jgi:4-amino-4-deoxy-L-arabinose transferase-like glycosyltransferase
MSGATAGTRVRSVAPSAIRAGFPGWIVLILATAALRLAFGWALGLGVDESYMVASGRELQFGYFDHPPLAWWIAWAAGRLFGSTAPVIERLPFIALFALSTWLIYRLTTRLFDARAGFWAAVLFNVIPVFGVSTGGWVLPDGPLDCALLAAALALVRALEDEAGGWRWWLASGAFAGLALDAKYSASLTLGGAFFFLLTAPRGRAMLRRPAPYAAAGLAVLLFAPVLAWNAAHGWASFAFQGGRALGGHFHPLAPLTVLGGEALFLLPWIWLPLVLSGLASVARGPGAWRG